MKFNSGRLQPAVVYLPDHLGRSDNGGFPAESFGAVARRGRPHHARGFSLVEILVALAIIGLVAALATSIMNPTEEADMIACAANAQAMRTLVEQTRNATFPLTPNWEQVKFVAGNGWDSHYHYIPNNHDKNSGHGNDLDICDEENPGNSGTNRDCLDIDFIIVCDHDHGSMAKYVAVLDDYGVRAFPNERNGGDDQPYLRDLSWWHGKDPNLRKWIGQS
jgi:prepilin-type N-terminal cleavage/methylation domain-containing protein